MYFVKNIVCFFILLTSVFFVHAEGNAQVNISVPIVINEELKKLSKLEIGEEIELKNSLIWKVNEREYYYLAVAYKRNQGCRFLFLDDTKKKIINDGGLFFEKCSFLKPPELLDINNDNLTDIRIWTRLPHHTGSKIMVNNHFDFIYKPELEIFCERTHETDCGKVIE